MRNVSTGSSTGCRFSGVQVSSTRCRLSGVHQVTKEVVDGYYVGIGLVLWPPEGHALSVTVILRVVGVDEGGSPEGLTDSSAICVHITVCVCEPHSNQKQEGEGGLL